MSEAPLSNLPEYSVSEIAGALKRTVEENFALVRVRGEVSGLKFHSSGHVYFDLKDDKAVLNAVIWRGTAARLKVRPEAGLEIVCTGKLSTYPGSSRYQIVVEQVELAGVGALMAMVEERRRRLAAEGLFDAARKKKLPFLPEVIGVITSPTGAVIRDIMHRLEARFPRRVLLWPVAVQGERAAPEVAAAIAGFNALAAGRPDLLIVARGGGSAEDLMAFNDEAVVRAAAASAIPLISAVGHETELLALTLDYQRRMLNCFTKGLDDRRRHLGQLARVLPRPEALFAIPRQRLDHAGEKLAGSLRRNLSEHRAGFLKTAALLRRRAIDDRIALGRERAAALQIRARRAQAARLAEAGKHLSGLARVLDGISYRAVLERGFALVKGADGTLRRRAGAIAAGEGLTLTFADGAVKATAGEGEGKPRTPPKTKKSPTDQGSLF